jgi:hypothetical protein
MQEFKQFEEKYKTMYSIHNNVKHKIICFEFLTLLFINWYRTGGLIILFSLDFNFFWKKFLRTRNEYGFWK